MSTFLFDDDDVALQRKVNDLLDWGLLLAVVGVLGLGLISIFSATSTPDAGTSVYFRNQLLYAAIGIAAGFAAFFIPERFIHDAAYPIYGLGILLLVVVLTPLGHIVNGQQCWIKVGSFTFQPSELAKITTLIGIARTVTQKGFEIRSLRDIGKIAGLLIVPLALIMLQPDTGSATVFVAMSLGIYLWIGGDLFVLYLIAAVPFIGVSALYGVLFDNMIWFAIVALLIACGAFLFRRNLIITITAILLLVGTGLAVRPVFNSLEKYKQNRLITLFEPERNPRGEGYHVIQSILAVGSGGVTGKGFLKGTQTQLRYIPEQWTDFIFCVPTEEFGFVGGVLVISLLVAVILRSIGIAAFARTHFAGVIAVGFASMLIFHTLVNIGMAIGLFPVMGIPLPFLSAGGTALIMNLAVVGFLLAIYKTRRRRASRIA